MNKITRRWPAEWEPQAAIWLSWPHNPDTWPGRLETIPPAFTKFVLACAQVVPTKVLVAPIAAETAREFLVRAENVELIDCPTNDCWIRDYGPTFVLEQDRLIGVDWKYNAWGGKYPPWDDDAQVAKRVCEHLNIDRSVSMMGCEGGAIETDGGGRMITTPDCVITDTRNPGWNKEQLAGEFYHQLGIVEILWLDGGGLEGDDTDGHVDQLARFVDPQNVVCAVSDNPEDPNAEGLEANYRQLRVWGRQTEPAIEVHRLPIPPERRIDGQRVPESYCNFLIAGAKRVIVPSFNSPDSDARAIELLTQLMPAMEIYPLDASDLVWGLGAFHCASQQMPTSSSRTADG